MSLSFIFRGCLLVSAAVLTACGSVGTPEQTCSVAPPADIKSDKKAAFDAAVDLKELTKMPLDASFKAELVKTFNATFQKVPDTAAACAMLNQTYVCLKDADRAAQYLQFMRETSQCNK